MRGGRWQSRWPSTSTPSVKVSAGLFRSRGRSVEELDGGRAGLDRLELEHVGSSRHRPCRPTSQPVGTAAGRAGGGAGLLAAACHWKPVVGLPGRRTTSTCPNRSLARLPLSALVNSRVWGRAGCWPLGVGLAGHRRFCRGIGGRSRARSTRGRAGSPGARARSSSRACSPLRLWHIDPVDRPPGREVVIVDLTARELLPIVPEPAPATFAPRAGLGEIKPVLPLARGVSARLRRDPVRAGTAGRGSADGLASGKFSIGVMPGFARGVPGGSTGSLSGGFSSVLSTGGVSAGGEPAGRHPSMRSPPAVFPRAASPVGPARSASRPACFPPAASGPARSMLRQSSPGNIRTFAARCCTWGKTSGHCCPFPCRKWRIYQPAG